MKVELIRDKHGETGFTMTPEDEADSDAFEQWSHLMTRPWEVTGYEYDDEKKRLISLTFAAK
jgi:hypothetical protein